MKTPEMNRRFDGFLHTPFLWDNTLEGLPMYSAVKLSNAGYPAIDSSSHIRLGKLIEQFVLFELEQDKTIELLKSNVQVFRNQITIGELDSLIKKSEDNIHLEIVYKFYLYDPSFSNELDRWIGPNRNDSLVHKLQKLKEKQLPLLYHSESTKILDKLNIKAEEFTQQLYFKAQLFVPFKSRKESYSLVNSDCIIGFYIRLSELKNFKNYSFYIPSKLDWLIAPHLDVEWLSTSTFHGEISKFLTSKKSPLCWMKSSEGKMSKFFITWW